MGGLTVVVLEAAARACGMEQAIMSEVEPRIRRDSNHLASLIVVVVAIAVVVAFLIWMNHFTDGIGF
jgi:hypothetical protein